MADEIKINLTVTVENGSYKDRFVPGQLAITQSTQGAASGILSIGTAAETVAFTDVTTEGILICQNLDATNFIELGPDSTGIQDFVKLKAGEFFIGRIKPGITVKAQADTAACKMYYLLLSD